MHGHILWLPRIILLKELEYSLTLIGSRNTVDGSMITSSPPKNNGHELIGIFFNVHTICILKKN